jgi:hypothetical protein
MPRHRGTAHHFNTDSSASYLNRNGLTIEALGRYRRELPIASSGARRLVKAMICAGGQDRMPTNKRERVYIYASMTPADQEAWDEIGLEPGNRPTGVIVGTVEVVGCRKVRGEYEWDLARPVRLKRPLKPKNHPQPAWFYPF